MALKAKSKAIRTRRTSARKSKFQANVAPAEERAIRLFKEELQISSNSDFLSDALALFGWVVSERKPGHKIISESVGGERRVLVFAGLERVASQVALPRV